MNWSDLSFVRVAVHIPFMRKKILLFRNEVGGAKRVVVRFEGRRNVDGETQYRIVSQIAGRPSESVVYHTHANAFNLMDKVGRRLCALPLWQWKWGREGVRMCEPGQKGLDRNS